MKVFVVVATKGRAAETSILMDFLERQTMLASRIVAVGTCSQDLDGLEQHSLSRSEVVKQIVSDRAGSSVQRNVGVAWVLENEADVDDALFVFFDDDFRPERHWLECCRAQFFENADLIGLTGHVLLDGARSGGVSELEANQALENFVRMGSKGAGRLSDCFSLYGCNMALRASIFRAHSFDENLPLYGWMEDLDLSRRAVENGGRLASSGACIGVHLGAQRGRTSGFRFGYSQVANPIYICFQGRLSVFCAASFVLRPFASNLIRCFRNEKHDYRGRLKGNLIAFLDVLSGKSSPLRILDF
ncbi:MAG: hypothetical protein H6R19_1697 [Proteobacteria bacterium]|nr:hypothetical protein [Pseudomonadota bacterium]